MLRSASPSEAAPKSGASGPNIAAISSAACAGFGSGWWPPKSSSGSPLITVPAGAPSSPSRMARAYGPLTALMASKRMR